MEVIDSQGANFLLKGDLLVQASEKAGYVAFTAHPMANTVLMEMVREGFVREIPTGTRNIKCYRRANVPENTAAPPVAVAPSPTIGSATISPAGQSLQHLCDQLFAFFESTGEGLIQMAREGRVLFALLESAALEAPLPQDHGVAAHDALDVRMRDLGTKIDMLTALLGKGGQDFQVRQEAVLRMLEAEAHRRASANTDAPDIPANVVAWRNGR